jgi:SAM-dependent methyltransferase
MDDDDPPTPLAQTAFADVPRRQGKPLDMRTLKRTIAWRREIARGHEESARRCRPARIVAACPACDGEQHALFVQIHGFDYRECARCGHLFLGNPPAPEAIAAIYQGVTAQAQVYVGEELFRRRVEQIARPKAAFCREYIEPSGQWFDVGCGTGELLSVVRALGWEPRGSEADPAHVEFARKQGLAVELGYVDELAPELADGVRVLSALNLLEHLPDPKAWLARLTAGLRPGGYVVVEVPRHPSLSSFSNLLYPKLAARHIYPPDHLHIFTEASLEWVLAASGLRARAVWVFGQDFQELMYSSAANAGLVESKLFHRILDAAGPIQRAIDGENLSDVLFVVAQKR